MKKIACTLFLLPGLLAGCRSRRSIAESPGLRDSVQVRVETRVEYVPDTVVLEVPAESIVQVRDTASHLETSYAVSDAVLRPDGRLYHSLENKARELPYEVKKEVVYRDSIVYRDRTVTMTEEVPRELTWWEHTRIKSFWWLLGLALVLAALAKGKLQ